MLSLESENGDLQRGVQGCAVATCCHHRCTWRHYVGKALFRSLGFSAAEFELISWMTGMLSYTCLHSQASALLATSFLHTVSPDFAISAVKAGHCVAMGAPSNARTVMPAQKMTTIVPVARHPLYPSRQAPHICPFIASVGCKY